MLCDPRESAEAAEAYVRWVEQHDHTSARAVRAQQHHAAEYLALRQVAENFAGFAVARSSWDGGTLEVRHWFGPDGASPRETFALRLHGGGVASAASLQPAEDELPPVDTVICVATRCAGPRGAAATGRTYRRMQRRLQAMQRCEAATLVLPFRQAADFAAMRLTVSAVRAMGRPELRVAVRECGKRLRAGQALALLRLGISCVIPLDMADLGARRMLEHLKGTRFARACEHDLEQVLDQTACALRGQADSAALFCEAVEGLLAAADGFDFETGLVRLTADRERRARCPAPARRAVT